MTVDLHCDLLAFLQKNPKRTVYDLGPRCSYPELSTGGVKLQTLAIYTDTEAGCVECASAQLEILKKLPSHTPFRFYDGELKDNVSVLAAIENASGLCGEEESLQNGLERLDALLNSVPCLYISLTWNEENRFGGGASTQIGLKEDGKRFLEAMSGRGVALDMSHTSDALAFGALAYIDQRSLDIPVMASHSNFRARCDQPRNLPDELAQEIIRRNGIIGLVFYNKFLSSPTMQGILEMVEYGFKLGGEKALAFGADFFCSEDFPQFDYGFPEGMKNASHFPALHSFFKKSGVEPTLFAENALRFIESFTLSKN